MDSKDSKEMIEQSPCNRKAFYKNKFTLILLFLKKFFYIAMHQNYLNS